MNAPHSTTGDLLARAATTLGIDLDADEQAIHAAYVRQIKTHPPDKDPDTFEQVRDAFQLLRDPLARARHAVLNVDPAAPLVALLDEPHHHYRYVGPEPWLQAVRERPKP